MITKIIWDKKEEKFISNDQRCYSILEKGMFGNKKKGIIYLNQYESFYLYEMRNFSFYLNEKKLNAFDLFSIFKKFCFKKYLVYKNIRDKGAIIKPGIKKGIKNNIIKYSCKKNLIKTKKIDGFLFDNTFVFCEEGLNLYKKHWFGQWATYKSIDRGKGLKLDKFESKFLIENNLLKLKNKTINLKKNEKKLYEVYCDWRKYYIIKSGFKFGAHFRIYMKNKKNNEWNHSEHVLWVFLNKKIITSKWVKAVRTAHSVKKTFILAIEKKEIIKKNFEKFSSSFYCFKKENKKNKPCFFILCLYEDEIINDQLILEAIEFVKLKKLDLIISIIDRDTSITHYRINEVKLKNSKNRYFEVKWFNF